MREFGRRHVLPEAYLLHPVFHTPQRLTPDLLPPLTEPRMPPWWLALDEEEQQRALRTVWHRAVDWAMERGADSVLVDPVMASRAERARFAAGADRVVDGWYAVDARSERLAPLLLGAFPRPVEIKVLARGALVLEVDETWNGIVAYSDGPSDIATTGW